MARSAVEYGLSRGGKFFSTNILPPIGIRKRWDSEGLDIRKDSTSLGFDFAVSRWVRLPRRAARVAPDAHDRVQRWPVVLPLGRLPLRNAKGSE
jgi:hypothetical protein